MPVTQFHEDTLDEYRTDLFHADNYALMKQVECDMEFQKVTRTRKYGHDIVCVNSGDLRLLLSVISAKVIPCKVVLMRSAKPQKYADNIVYSMKK